VLIFHVHLVRRIYRGKTGATADRDKIEFILFNSSSIFNITLLEELFSLPHEHQTMHSCPGFMVLVTRVKFLGEKLQATIPPTACHNDSVQSSCQINLTKHQLRIFISQSKPQLPVVSMDVFLIVCLLTYRYIALLQTEFETFKYYIDD